MKKFKIGFLFLIAIALWLINFVIADTECIGGDCSVGISLNFAGNPSSFTGFVRDLTGNLISVVNVEILGNIYSDITIDGFYNITQDLGGLYDLKASKDGYLTQIKSNQLAKFGETKQVDFALGLSGKIKGNTVDFFSAVGINNANMSLFLYNKFLSSTLTNASGYYEFNDLAPGYYDINVEATGYNPNSKPDNHVLVGESTTVDFLLW